jgi:hypothetical protein
VVGPVQQRQRTRHNSVTTQIEKAVGFKKKPKRLCLRLRCVVCARAMAYLRKALDSLCWQGVWIRALVSGRAAFTLATRNRRRLHLINTKKLQLRTVPTRVRERIEPIPPPSTLQNSLVPNQPSPKQLLQQTRTCLLHQSMTPTKTTSKHQLKHAETKALNRHTKLAAPKT